MGAEFQNYNTVDSNDILTSHDSVDSNEIVDRN